MFTVQERDQVKMITFQHVNCSVVTDSSFKSNPVNLIAAEEQWFVFVEAEVAHRERLDVTVRPLHSRNNSMHIL